MPHRCYDHGCEELSLELLTKNNHMLFIVYGERKMEATNWGTFVLATKPLLSLSYVLYFATSCIYRVWKVLQKERLIWFDDASSTLWPLNNQQVPLLVKIDTAKGRPPPPPSSARSDCWTASSRLGDCSYSWLFRKLLGPFTQQEACEDPHFSKCHWRLTAERLCNPVRDWRLTGETWTSLRNWIQQEPDMIIASQRSACAVCFVV